MKNMTFYFNFFAIYVIIFLTLLSNLKSVIFYYMYPCIFVTCIIDYYSSAPNLTKPRDTIRIAYKKLRNTIRVI